MKKTAELETEIRRSSDEVRSASLVIGHEERVKFLQSARTNQKLNTGPSKRLTLIL
jgi:hypothetical protein